MSMFDLHATVLQDYKDFVQKFSTMADDRRAGRCESETVERTRRTSAGAACACQGRR